MKKTDYLRETDCINGTNGTDKCAMWLRLREMSKYIERKEGLSQRGVARLIGRNSSSYNSAVKGRVGYVTETLLLDLYSRYKDDFNLKWVKTGEGDMLIKSADDIQKASTVVNQAWANNSPNAMVNAAYNGNITVSEGENTKRNKYGDSPNEERRWCPVVPTSMARQGNFDIMGHVTKQIGGSMERLYAGTAPIDVWHYVTDNDLYPFYQKGDCLGLKAYDIDDRRIKTGNIYVVDTNRDGFIFRRFRLLENGDFESYTFNESDPQSYVIPQEDIIRVYSVVLMFRY